MKRYKRHQSGSAANERSGRVVKVKLNLLSLLALILAVSTALVWGPSLVHWAFGAYSGERDHAFRRIVIMDSE
ncbi:hypothetical protein QZN20_26050 [Burkholderia multivorans]|nr:hypothetical protein [Burkholderia multivorans]